MLLNLNSSSSSSSWSKVMFFNHISSNNHLIPVILSSPIIRPSFFTTTSNDKQKKDSTPIYEGTHLSKSTPDSSPETPEISRRFFTIPNILCYFRIGISPYIGHLIIQNDLDTAASLVVLAGVTDLLDGFIAKNFNQRSLLGSFLDPLADKILLTALSTSMAVKGLLPLPLVALMISRDVALIFGAAYYRYITLPPPITLSRFVSVSDVPSFDIQPHTISKFNTVLQLATTTFTLFSAAISQDLQPTWFTPYFLPGLWTATAFTTFGSGLSYAFNPSLRAISRERREAKKSKNSVQK